METLIHADIFFFISSIAVVVFVLVSLIVGFYLVKTMRDIREMIATVKKETAHIVDDVDELRENVKSKVKLASKFAHAITSAAFIRDILKQGKKKRSEDD